MLLKIFSIELLTMPYCNLYAPSYHHTIPPLEANAETFVLECATDLHQPLVGSVDCIGGPRNRTECAFNGNASQKNALPTRVDVLHNYTRKQVMRVQL